MIPVLTSLPNDASYLDIIMIIFTAAVAGFAGWLFRRVERIERNHADIRVINTKLDSISDHINNLTKRIDSQDADHAAIRTALQSTREDVAAARAELRTWLKSHNNI